LRSLYARKDGSGVLVEREQRPRLARPERETSAVVGDASQNGSVAASRRSVRFAFTTDPQL
jgi:hypothetical protein